MYKIQTLNKIATDGLELLSRDKYEVASEIPAPDGIIVRSFKMHDMQFEGNLKCIARAGAGVNNIPLDICTERGIVVFNTPGANANAVKELVITALLLSSRDISAGINWAKTIAGESGEVPKLVEKQKSQFTGPEIKGKKLGVIGLGAIGVMVANAASSLDMEVSGYDPFISVESAWGLSRSVEKSSSIENLLKESDYISLHVPLNEKTKGLLNEDKFAQMKTGVRLINLARGGLVNNEDLKNAIASGKISKYVTDFPDSDLLNTKNIIALPHLGASTPESENNCAKMAVEEIKGFLEQGNIKNSVNFPNCEMHSQFKNRLIIANKNIPNMVGQITTLLANENINIVDMLNKSRGDVAFNIINIEGSVSSDSLAKLTSTEGILMCRLIKN